MKNWDTISGLLVLMVSCFVTYKTEDSFYAILSFLGACYLLRKAGLKVAAWLNQIEENETKVNVQSSAADHATNQEETS